MSCNYYFLKLSELCFLYIFYTSFNKIRFYIYGFKLLLITLLRLITSLMPIFLPSSIMINQSSILHLIFSTSLLWLFILLMLYFSFRYLLSSWIIVLKFSSLISLFVNGSDILLSMLFNLLLASMAVLLRSILLLSCCF